MVLKTAAGAPITCSDWNNLTDIDGFLALGRNRYPYSYVIYTDGLNYYAENGTTGNLDYGGPTNEGAASGIDASAVIQGALTALASGGHIFIKRGTFNLFSMMTGGTDITIEGMGKATILQCSANYAVAQNYVFSLGSRCSVRNLIIDGNNKVPPTVAIGFIPATTVNDTLVEKVEIKNIRSGITVAGNGGSDNRILDNYIHDMTGTVANPGSPIQVNSAAGNHYDTIISGNVLRRLECVTSAGIVLITTIDGSFKHYRAIITDNVVGEIKEVDGIELYYHVYDSVVSNNTIFSWTRSPIRLDGSSRNTVSDNIIMDFNDADYSCTYGIHVYARSDQPADENIISGNVIHTYKAYMAIQIQGTAATQVYYNKVIGNIIYRTNTTNVALGAIYAEYCGAGTVIEDNTVLQARTNGIYVTLSDRVTIQDNVIRESGFTAGNVGHGIYILGDHHTIKGNEIQDMGLGGTANTCDGIYINGDYNNVISNRVYDWSVVARYCINEAAGSDDNRMLNNTLVGGQTARVNIVGVSTELHTKPFRFINHGGGSAGWTAPVINTSPGGIDIDANDEFAYTYITLPNETQQVVRVKIWAYANVLEADAMRLRIVGHGATDNEAWSGNAIDVANHPSESSNFAASDVIYWMIDASDDAQVGTLAARDYMEIMAVGEVAGGADCATDALFGGVEIDYV